MDTIKGLMVEEGADGAAAALPAPRGPQAAGDYRTPYACILDLHQTSFCMHMLNIL